MLCHLNGFRLDVSTKQHVWRPKKESREQQQTSKQTSFSLMFFPECKKKKKECSSSVCELGRGINRWNAHGKSESQYCNHPPYVKWPVMLCHTAQESCHIYQQRVESKSAVIGRPFHNRSLKRPLLTHFFFPPSYGSGKRGRKKKPLLPTSGVLKGWEQFSRLKGLPNNQQHIHNEGAADGGAVGGGRRGGGGEQRRGDVRCERK